MAKVRTGVLVILDGFGINPSAEFNAIAQAKKENFDRLFHTYPHTQLSASETQVGLPDGFMGNSEVGHLNIGAGRVVYQDFSLISKAIEDGTFFGNRVFLGALSRLKTHPEAALHLVGLVSDGGVHSHIQHLFSLMELAKEQGIREIWVHVITDGRDTSPTGGMEFVKRLKEFCEAIGVAKMATLSGRFFAMDRDKRWERTEQAYRAMVVGQSEDKFDDPLDCIGANYDKNITDEFIPPTVSRSYTGIEDGDAVFFFNFRADRARQLTAAITSDQFEPFERPQFPTLCASVMMTPYDEALEIPAAFEKPKVLNTLGDVVSQNRWKQLRIAETEKYAHVTYFFNGGEEKPFQGEKRVLVPSPREVKTYDLKPEMNAPKVVRQLTEELESGEYQFVVCNFANPDMVGHTGNFPAAVKAVEVVDKCIGKIVDWVESRSAFMVVTADHGNCEMMRDASGRPHTAHTLNPVPLIVVDPRAKNSLSLKQDGRLCDIAPTFMTLWGESAPSEMSGRSLI